MTEKSLFIVNTIMLAFNVTMIVVQIIIGACMEDTYDDDREDWDNGHKHKR